MPIHRVGPGLSVYTDNQHPEVNPGQATSFFPVPLPDSVGAGPGTAGAPVTAAPPPCGSSPELCQMLREARSKFKEK